MTILEIAARLGGTLAGSQSAAGSVASGGYASDLLSDVIGNAREGDAWVTLQKHVNVVAVARLKGLSAIVLVNGRAPEPDTAARAAEQGVAIITTPLSAFDAAGVLYALGLRGGRTS